MPVLRQTSYCLQLLLQGGAAVGAGASSRSDGSDNNQRSGVNVRHCARSFYGVNSSTLEMLPSQV